MNEAFGQIEEFEHQSAGTPDAGDLNGTLETDAVLTGIGQVVFPAHHLRMAEAALLVFFSAAARAGIVALDLEASHLHAVPFHKTHGRRHKKPAAKISL